MITYSIEEILPGFILADRNGYAMAKALEACLNYFLARCQEGLDALLDIDKMPEWRLDEMAWEYNCLYDYKADIDAKRGWIKNAYDYYKCHGTAEGIKQYLGAYFYRAAVAEWFDAELEPGYFDVIVSGLRTAASEAWIRASVEKAKNVRSLLRNVIFYGGETRNTMHGATGIASMGTVDKVTMIPDAYTSTIRDIEDMTISTLQRRDIRKLQ